MIIKQVSGQEYELMASLEPGGNIFQSCLYGQLLNDKGYEPIFIEYLNDSGVGQAYGAFYLKKDSFFSFKPSAYCFSGFLINYYDNNLLKSFIVDLLDFFKDKNIKKLVIDPFLFSSIDGISNRSIIQTLKDSGFELTDEKYIYEYDLSNSHKNSSSAFLKLIKLSNDYEGLNKLIDKDTYDIYNTFKDKITLYGLEFKIKELITQLNIEMNELTKFMSEYKDDLNRSKDVSDAKQRVDQINETFSYLDEYKGDKQILCVSAIINYSNKYYVLFIHSNDHDDFFKGKVTIMNEVCKEAKKAKIKTVYSYNELPDSIKKELVGEYTYNY